MHQPATSVSSALPAGRANFPEDKAEYQQFYEALDQFSFATTSESWFTLSCARLSKQPWNDDQRALLARALSKAPQALMVAPYNTIQNIMIIRDLAAKRNELPQSFWAPLREACIVWQDDGTRETENKPACEGEK